MKNLLLSLCLLSSSISCSKTELDPKAEVEATILNLVLNPTVCCTCCQGYRVQIGSKQYFTNHVAAPYDKPNTAVLITYEQPEDGCEQSENRIQIVSIRSR